MRQGRKGKERRGERRGEERLVAPRRAHVTQSLSGGGVMGENIQVCVHVKGGGELARTNG